MRELHSLGKHWSAMKLLLQERFSDCGNSTMAKHKLTTFRQTDLAMHEYISYFSDLVEHAYTFTHTDPAGMILVSNFIQGIMNPHIRNKLRCCKIPNLQDTLHNCTWGGSKSKDQGFGLWNQTWYNSPLWHSSH